MATRRMHNFPSHGTYVGTLFENTI